MDVTKHPNQLLLRCCCIPLKRQLPATPRSALLVFLERAPSPDLLTGEGGLDLEKLGDVQFNWKGKKEQGAKSNFGFLIWAEWKMLISNQNKQSHDSSLMPSFLLNLILAPPSAMRTGTSRPPARSSSISTFHHPE